MSTYDLGTATVSVEGDDLLKASYEREKLAAGETATAAQILDWIREDTRNLVAHRVTTESRLQRHEGGIAGDEALDDGVTVA